MMPRYRIQEYFEPRELKTYFAIQKSHCKHSHTMGSYTRWEIIDCPRIDNLEIAKAMVRTIKKYDRPIHHYLEEDEE